jgi:hypothetical protein
MMDFALHLASVTAGTVVDVLPIALILFVFQAFVLRKKPANLGRILWGFIYVLMGLSLFLVGLEEALFPLGKTMAKQLTDAKFLGIADAAVVHWQDYMWVYIFAAAIGFSTTVAEPSLIAITIKAEEVSGGALKAFGLRMAVAVGVSVGVSVGAYRIVSGTPLPYYIMAGYALVIIQTFFASKGIIALAYDSGGVTTSTVTVPVVAALGLGLATAIPGRSPLLDGFGLIAFASVFPIVSVLGYDMLANWLRHRDKMNSKEDIQ